MSFFKSIFFYRTGIRLCFLLACSVFFFLGGCQIGSGSYYQKQVAIPKTQWDYSFKPTFTIDIKDTAARYQMYFLMRHDEAYPYANIWVGMSVQSPQKNGFSETKRIEKQLAQSDGTWMGRGMGGIWEHKIPFTAAEGIQFNEIGAYTIQLEQIMRMNPLPSVLNVGLIVEKISK